MDLTSLALRSTQSVGVLASHWPGIWVSVVAALDQLDSIRLAFWVLPSRELRETNDDNGLLTTLVRTDKCLTLLKWLCSNAQLFDLKGLFYRIHGGFAPMKAVDGAIISGQLGGLSGEELKIAGRHPDRFELPAGGFDDTFRLIEHVRIPADYFGLAQRTRFSCLCMSARVHRPGSSVVRQSRWSRR